MANRNMRKMYTEEEIIELLGKSGYQKLLLCKIHFSNVATILLVTTKAPESYINENLWVVDNFITAQIYDDADTIINIGKISIDDDGGGNITLTAFGYSDNESDWITYSKTEQGDERDITLEVMNYSDYINR